ncbi:nitrogen fixation protein NifH [Candidatus Bathyarchaeota archaeon]|nr:nitrogen fixation protein NifH [Candidatus Bathyarchaeota archaeon]
MSWLLEKNYPSVRFWALLDLMDKSSTNPEVLETQNNIMKSPEIMHILEAQNKEGYWINKTNIYLPKYTATTHCLLILAELGAKKTPEIEKGIEFVYRSQRNSGHFLVDIPKTKKGKSSSVKDGCCIDGNILTYLIHFGYLNDDRTKKLLNFIIDYHSDDSAGWKCRSYPINKNGVFPINCYMGAVKVLKALSFIPKEKRSKSLNFLVDREVENILENYIYKYLRNPDGSRKDKAGWKKFGFPLFYQSDALEVLDILVRLGKSDDRMQPAIDLVLKSRQPNHKWLLNNTFNSKMLVNFEEKGKPSKWITLRALRVLKHFGIEY